MCVRKYYTGRNEERVEAMVRLREELVSSPGSTLIEAPGRWIHELDAHNKPSGHTLLRKPDVYHAAQCMLMPSMPLTPCSAGALAHR